MDWNCALTEERLSDFLDGSMSAAERKALDEHSASCAKCAEIVARVGELVSQMHALELLREPTFLAQRIARNTTGVQTLQHDLASIAGWLKLIWQPRFAMGVATVAVTLVILAHATGAQLRNLRPSDLNPVNLFRAGNRKAHLTYARGEKFVNDLRVVYEIRAVLAAPEPASSGTTNQSEPKPDNTNPDTGEHPTPIFKQIATVRTTVTSSNWATLLALTGGTAPNAPNRRMP